MEPQILCVVQSSEGSHIRSLVTLNGLAQSHAPIVRSLAVCRGSGDRACKKETGRKIYSPPGLKLGVMTPKTFGAVNPALGLVPLFLR